ncbi:P-loop containing nucleoside triphosphate hydrolase protein [Amylocarpus encephaloides]|uniref:ATP-dependent RNA helicase n=1 Tax=Amylocarpus encephaloides TaxID=45428 RepID=A0A9P7YLB6_9HELO|nr:P-loop containing nucleoside triphosphate hydrolase protein [Amylocarpus encephaloides]
MDILKVLSRATKNKRASATRPSKFPSAGSTETPQLYHDATEDARGKKRKRGGGKTEEQAHDGRDGDDGHDGEALDFFAPKPPKTKAKSQRPYVAEAAQTDTSPPARTSATPPELLEEGECRRILQSHRLKVTLLPRTNPIAVKAKVKKAKKNKATKEASTKAEFRQIFPQPLSSFSDLRKTYSISGRVAENLAQQGYQIPTEVQMGSLPLLLQPQLALGKDAARDLATSTEGPQINLLSVAPTGSGKTLAFLIPVVNQAIQRRRKGATDDGHSLDAIIVAPTKELASQIVNEAKKLSLGTGIRVVGMRKGMRVAGTQDDVQESDREQDEDGNDDPHKPGRQQPVTKADILISTPGLLLSSISSREENVHLPTVRTLVLDEADVLLDPLFRDQTFGIWNACTRPELTVTLWSATMGSNIENLASSTIQSRRQRLGLKKEFRTVRLVVGLKDSAIPNITHHLTYAATEPGKLLALRQLLHPTAGTSSGNQSLRPPFLVFTQTIPRAVALHSELLYDISAQAGGSSRIAVLHSDLSDSSRDSVMTRFRNGEIWILITTDILSRGVDFRGVNGVVNYDVPNSGAAYIHRVGRTGRAGRDGGVAVTFYTKEDIPYVKNVANIIAASEKQAGKPPSEASMQKWFLDALPNPSKEEKKQLKKHGVEARRGGLSKGNTTKDKGSRRSKMLISTRSGYERRLEHNRKGAIQGSKRREKEEMEADHDSGKGSEFTGFN